MPHVRDIPLLNLARCQCRFPVSEDPSVPGSHLFCAAPTAADRVYCDHHNTVATAVEPRRSASRFNSVPRLAA
ncbi:GcrA family cell cycle regulator [Mesorhizobium marinum]|uniref:GcrA family cell cycle regulator n=1 Tax=Mesorhizobium marinum TaxID=3228790 RepID=A0ABV3QXW3_9HYPH